MDPMMPIVGIKIEVSAIRYHEGELALRHILGSRLEP